MNVTVRTIAAFVLALMVVAGLFMTVQTILNEGGESGEDSSITETEILACLQSHPDKDREWCKNHIDYEPEVGIHRV